MTTPTRNSWLLDCAADICVCNQRELFTDFVESPTALSGVTSAGVSPGWGTVSLMLALENGQIGAQIQMVHVLYIPQSPVSLISLHKLNKAGFYWDNRSWSLSDEKRGGKIVGYVLKWRQN